MKTALSDPPACTENLLAMQDTLDVLGGKWKLLILQYLIFRENDTNTFKKMERDIVGISAKMLSKELKDLEANKLISRTVKDTKPITVEYSITEYGKSTSNLIHHLVDWGKKHRHELLKSYK